MKTNMTQLEKQLYEQAELLHVDSDPHLVQRVVNQIQNPVTSHSTPKPQAHWLSRLMSGSSKSRSAAIGALASVALAAIIIIALPQQPTAPAPQGIVKLANNLESKLNFSLDQLVAQREVSLESELEKIEADMQKISNVVGINSLALLK